MSAFSLTVPVGAWHPLLEQCFASLAAQKPKLQVALLDASGDERVVQAADQWNGLFHYRYHGPDKGQADAIATGWEQTSGRILGWLNADDALYPDALEMVLARFDSPDAPGVVYGHSTIVDGEGRLKGWQYGVEPPSERLGYAAALSQPSCFFLRDACNDAGSLNRELHYTMDWDLFLRLYHQGTTFAFIDKALSQVLWDQGTKTASLTQRRREEILRIHEAYPPPGSRAASLRGFRTQNIIDGSPQRVRELITSVLMRNARPFFGLRGDGMSETGFTLPLMHYNTRDVIAARISFANRLPMNVKAALNDVACEVEAARKTLTIHFPDKLTQAQRMNLVLKFDAPGARFRWLELVR
ncbi:MAG: glycosyltransferase [Pseudomonadota bacterium]